MNKVSILVPIYRVEKYIERCARSLFEQSYDKIEYIFVDDSSPDKSLEVLQMVIDSYPKRKQHVKIVRHKRNRGLAASRNTAIFEATGDFIFHMDSDDYLDKDAILLMITKARACHADIVTCDYNMVYEGHSRVLKSWCCEDKVQYIRALLTRRTSFNLSGKLISKSLVTNYGIHNIEGLNQGEDYSTYPRLVYYAKKCSYVEKTLYQYIQYKKDSYTHAVDDNGRQQIIKAASLLIDFFKNTEVVKNDPYLIPDIKFFNQITLFMTSPYSKYKEIVGILPEINSINSNNYNIVYRIFNYCMQRKMFGVLWFLIQIKLWQRK